SIIKISEDQQRCLLLTSMSLIKENVADKALNRYEWNEGQIEYSEFSLSIGDDVELSNSYETMPSRCCSQTGTLIDEPSSVNFGAAIDEESVVKDITSIIRTNTVDISSDV